MKKTQLALLGTHGVYLIKTKPFFYRCELCGLGKINEFSVATFWQEIIRISSLRIDICD